MIVQKNKQQSKQAAVAAGASPKPLNRIKDTKGETAFRIFNDLLMFVLMVVMIYPVLYVIMASLSDNNMLMGYTGILLKPLGFSVNAYKLMLKNPMILKGYANTILIVLISVPLNLIFTSIAAYVLSRKNVYWQKYIMMFIVFTMFFSGGLIPSYLINTKIFHLKDSYAAIILPGLISTYNMIIMRTSFAAVPVSLEESARIDGASHWVVLFRIVLPLSMAVIAVMVLYYAVAQWNSWFAANIYLSTRSKYPLQLVLREILISNDTSSMTAGSGGAAGDQQSISETVKYAIIVVATLPILCIYPFLQKYFVKGVMIGAVKG